ncbi:snare-like protein [Hypoxylon fragiforme]|uniref:snare-like protein n=1 Tax=Hypoxylon fragiforme TaxID=63214 RepID=UPI0020C6D480|nr:snare-like protein [Hypoxylon fragiforme]KAI2605937.1 snare-like protein [Hypoxylon fragiforme]
MPTAIPSIACLGVIGRNNNPLHITIFASHDPTTNTRAPLRTPLQFSLLLSSTLDVFETRARRAATASTTSTTTASSGSPAPTTPGAAGAGGAATAPIVTGDFGLLHAVDERLAAYGFETNTGVKFVAVVDMRGRFLPSDNSSGSNTNTNNNTSASASNTTLAGGGSGGPAPAAAAAVGGLGLRTGVGLREAELRVVFRAMQTAYVRLLQNPFYDPDEHAPLILPPAGGGGVGGKRISSRRFAEEMRRIGEGWAPGVTVL